MKHLVLLKMKGVIILYHGFGRKREFFNSKNIVGKCQI